VRLKAEGRQQERDTIVRQLDRLGSATDCAPFRSRPLALGGNFRNRSCKNHSRAVARGWRPRLHRERKLRAGCAVRGRGVERAGCAWFRWPGLPNGGRSSTSSS
jgi:hypothetical protein